MLDEKLIATATEEDTPRLLTTREALKRLNQRLVLLEGKPAVSIDTFYHRVARGGIPYEVVEKKVKAGTKRESIRTYYFKPQDIDAIQFRGKYIFKLPRGFEPHAIKSTDDLKPLIHQFGPLVNTDGLIRYLFEKTGHKYTRGAIKNRRIRGTLAYVAYLGGDRKRDYWYPVKQLDHMNWMPDGNRALQLV